MISTIDLNALRRRRSRKLTVAECPTLDVRDLPAYGPGRTGAIAYDVTRRNGFGTVRVRYAPAAGAPQEHEIDLASTQPNYGGLRWWLVCPPCDGRARTLYLPPGRANFACRSCHRLAYESQRRTALQRDFDRARAIDAKLGAARDDLLPPRPKGMHWTRYVRLTEERRRRRASGLERLHQWLEAAQRRLGRPGSQIAGELHPASGRFTRIGTGTR